MICNRCNGTGFVNSHQISESNVSDDKFEEYVISWMKANENHDVHICDCCGDEEYWYGIRGEHYHKDDPEGRDGPYDYNGGLCECN